MIDELVTPIPTGDWGKDNRLGRRYAAALVEVMRSREAPFMLGQRARDLMQDEANAGIAAGFFQAIAEGSIRAA